MLRNENIELEFQPTIPGPPYTPKRLMAQSASNDEVTIESWKDTWIEQAKKNHALRGPFGANGCGQLFNQLKNQACIVVGSGPSLKINILQLVEASKHLPVISCLHNFHYLEDHEVKVDYYVTLDAGPITVSEVSEGGTRTPEEYWALTKDRTLLAYVGCNSELVAKWQGKILWFNCPVPSPEINDRIAEIELFNCFIGTGGNVLGAAFYLAKGIMAANPVIFVGADFGFSYDKKFHGWDSSYDKAGVGQAMKVTDIFGNRIHTWPSYYNFKLWFDRAAALVPGIYINATEGGCFGAYPEGNIRQVIQMALSDVVKMYSHCEVLREMCENPDKDFRHQNGVTLLF